jgi:hypothetical protein
MNKNNIFALFMVFVFAQIHALDHIIFGFSPERHGYGMPDGTSQYLRPATPEIDNLVRAVLGDLIPQDKPLVILQHPEGFDTTVEYAAASQNSSCNYIILNNICVQDLTMDPSGFAHRALLHEAGHLHFNHMLCERRNAIAFWAMGAGMISIKGVYNAYNNHDFFKRRPQLERVFLACMIGSIYYLFKTIYDHEKQADQFSWEKINDKYIENALSHKDFQQSQPRRFIDLLKQLCLRHITLEEFWSRATHPGPYENYHFRLSHQQDLRIIFPMILKK